MEAVVLLLVLFVLAAVLLAGHIKNQRIQSARQKISRATEQHLAVLARKRLQTLKVDEYGIVDSKKWSKEVDYFLTKVVLPQLSEAERAALVGMDINALATELVEGPAKEYSIVLESKLQYDGSMTPLEYEHYCARLLNSAGWTTNVTKASGDQGADVLATRAARRVVIQCKKYAGAVGNSAVQEAYAAMRHYGCTEAAVVTTGEFTSSAKQLAASTGVILLHHSQLLDMPEKARG